MFARCAKLRAEARLLVAVATHRLALVELEMRKIAEAPCQWAFVEDTTIQVSKPPAATQQEQSQSFNPPGRLLSKPSTADTPSPRSSQSRSPRSRSSSRRKRPSL